MSNLGKVVRQEFKMTTGNRAFVIITIIGPFLIIAMAVLPGLFANRGMAGREAVVGVYGAPESLVLSLKQAAEENNFTFVAGENREKLVEMTKDEDISGFLEFPEDYLESRTITYYSKTGTDIYVSEALTGIINSILLRRRLIEEGIPPETTAALMEHPSIETKAVETGRTEDFFSIILTSIALVMLIYMTVLLYGQMIGRAVIMEKSSKTVEIMLSSVRPGELLMGKIFGRGLAGILQYGVWIAVAIVIARILGPALNIELPATLTLPNLGYLLLFFIFAFFLYSSLYAALGAGAEDDQHLGQLGWPLIFFLVVPLMLVSFLVMNPESTVSVVLSFFPLTAPIVMFIRVLITSPPAWQVLLCLGILAGSIGLAVAGATKVFRIGILMTGKKYSLKEILRWIRY